MADLKLICFMTRRPDFTLDQFSEYWRTIHKAHALKLVEPGYMKGYIQNHRLPQQPEGLSCPYDGSPELWIEHLGVLQELAASPEYLTGAGPDEANFMVVPATTAVAEEVMVIDPLRPEKRGGLVKAMLIYRRQPTLSQAEFSARCGGIHHPLVMPGASPLGLTRQMSLEDPEQGLERAAFDVVECSWWPNVDSFNQAWSGRNTASAETMVEAERAIGMLVTEELGLAPR